MRVQWWMQLLGGLEDHQSFSGQARLDKTQPRLRQWIPDAGSFIWNLVTAPEGPVTHEIELHEIGDDLVLELLGLEGTSNPVFPG